MTGGGGGNQEGVGRNDHNSRSRMFMSGSLVDFKRNMVWHPEHMHAFVAVASLAAVAVAIALAPENDTA